MSSEPCTCNNGTAGCCSGDIKPQNLCWDAEACTLLLCDFGLSFSLASGPRGQPAYSEHYAAPEAARWNRYGRTCYVLLIGSVQLHQAQREAAAGCRSARCLSGCLSGCLSACLSACRVGELDQSGLLCQELQRMCLQLAWC